MYVPKKLALLLLGLGLLFNLSSCSEDLAKLDLPENSPSINQPQVKAAKHNAKNKSTSLQQQKLDCQRISLKFIQADNAGNTNVRGSNYVLIFDPKILDFYPGVLI